MAPSKQKPPDLGAAMATSTFTMVYTPWGFNSSTPWKMMGLWRLPDYLSFLGPPVTFHGLLGHAQTLQVMDDEG